MNTCPNAKHFDGRVRYYSSAYSKALSPRIADEILNIPVAKMFMMFVIGVENILGKGENAGYCHSLFMSMFSKANSLSIIETMSLTGYKTLWESEKC